MTGQPVVSKRMAELLSWYTNALTIRSIAAWGEYDVEKARAQLLDAIAEIEQRAEKWKAVALTHVALMQSLSGSVDEVNAASKKAVDACKALGDEWGEVAR